MPITPNTPDCGVYEIWCLVSGKVYVGSSVNVAARLLAHFSRLCRGRHENIHLQRAWDMYGEGAFWGYCVTKCSAEDQFATEQVYLDALPPTSRFNIGVEAGRGDRYARKGSHNTVEHNARISGANRGRPSWNKGGVNTWATEAAASRADRSFHILRAEHTDGRVIHFVSEAEAARKMGYKRKRINESLRRGARLTTGWLFRREPKGVCHPDL